MANTNNVRYRGSENPTNSAYTDTVADYSGSSTPIGDNVIENVACDSTVYVGSVVRMNGSTVVNALADSKANSEVIGICISKSTSEICNILICGNTGNIYGSLNTSVTYYLSDSVLGALTSTPPTTSGSYVIKIGKTQNSQNLILQYERIVKRA